MDNFKIELNSEIGRLRGVVLHRPGLEIENMTPLTIQKALYSDLLSVEISQKEYLQLEGILNKYTNTYYIDDLLLNSLESEEAREFLFNSLSRSENINCEPLKSFNEANLVKILINGNEAMGIIPLYNFFFTRDIGVCFNNRSVATKMATKIRGRENLLTSIVYKYNAMFAVNNSYANLWTTAAPNAMLEGGDFLVESENVFLIGQGARSNKEGVLAVINEKVKYCDHFHIITQQLPELPESFIHLDMVFTLLGRDKCMIYSSLIFSDKFETTLIEVKNGKISEYRENNILEALRKLGKNYEPILCGGEDLVYQDREQWHSGANFFTLAPNKIMGYARNLRTIDSLNKAGFDVIRAKDILSGSCNVLMEDEGKPTVITIESSELVRGGGGCRCMTMPISRDLL